jgi:Carboxypeptidase regulatory-like domain
LRAPSNCPATPSRLAVRLLFFAALAVLPISSSAQVQAPVVGQAGTPRTRAIEGTVLSSAGAPVSGAVVLLKNVKTLQVRSFIAQQDGKYRFYGLSTDVNWQLRAEAGGMTSKTKTVSVFDSHPRVMLNLKLDRKKSKT